MDKSLWICAMFVMYTTLQVHCATTKDVIFVIDRSGSIGNSDLQIGLEFIYNVTSWLTIGTGAINVAVVSFDGTPRTDINLGTYTAQATLLQAINSLTLVSGGSTDTASALSHVRTSVIPNGRSNVDKAVVVLTDGLSNSKFNTISAASSLKAVSGVSLFSVGIGSALLTNNDEIRQMASDPETYFVHFVYSFVYICNLVPSIVPKLDPNSTALSIAGCPSIPPNLQSGWFPWETETTTETTAETTTETTTGSTIDVIFVIDRSGSIGNSDLQIGLEFIYNVTSWLMIGTGAINVAVVSFADTSRTDINLGTYTTQATLLQAINSLTLVSGGGTDTASALSHVRTSVIPSGRSNVDKAVVVLTDGLSNSKFNTISAASSLKAVSGVSLFSVGIGSALLTNNDEIRQMASDPETYFVHFVYSFIYICNLVPSIVPKLDPNSTALSIAGCPSIPPNLQSGWFPWETETTTETTAERTTEKTAETTTETTAETTTETTAETTTATTTETTAETRTETTTGSTIESKFDNRIGEFVTGVLVGCVSLFLVTFLLYILWSRIITFPSTLPLITKTAPSTIRNSQQETRRKKLKEDKTRDRKEDEKRKKREDNGYPFASGNVLTNYAPFSTSLSKSAR